MTDGPAIILPLSRVEKHALANVARSLRGVQRMAPDKARAALGNALLRAVSQFDTEAGAMALINARGKDVLATAVKSLNPLETRAVMLWLIANKDSRDAVNAELDALLEQFRQNMAAQAQADAAPQGEDKDPQGQEVPAA